MCVVRSAQDKFIQLCPPNILPQGRLVRLIPDDEANADTEKGAIKAFFNYRLPDDAEKARLEWLDIVEARHALWQHISTPKKELIRSFLNLINLEIVKRVRPSSVFNFSSASIGNLFLTGYVASQSFAQRFHI